MLTDEYFEKYEKEMREGGNFPCKACGMTIYSRREECYYLDGDERYPICYTCNEILNNAINEDYFKQKEGIVILRRMVAQFDDPDRQFIQRYVPKEVKDIIRRKLAEAEVSLEAKQVKVTEEDVKRTLRRGDDDYYLYHSYKNEKALIYVIVISFLVFFVKMGFVCSIGVWLLYYLYCERNNAKLNNDPYILKRRESVRRMQEYYANEQNSKNT